MGTLYYIGCLDCGIYRDLDKHMAGAINTPQNRKDAKRYVKEEIKQQPFKYGLLVSFLLDHAEHRCKFFSEHEKQDFDDQWDPIIDGVTMCAEKKYFWDDNKPQVTSGSLCG